MKTAMIYLAALLSFGTVARAEEASVQPEPAPCASQCATQSSFALDFSVDADYYAFTDEIVVITPEIGFAGVLENLDLTVALPLYNDSVTTGLGNLNFGADYTLFNGKCGFLAADSASLGVNAQFGLPLDGEFSSDDPVWALGGDLSLGWGKIAFHQTAEYQFESGSVFLPQFGGFVDGSVFSADSTLAYSLTEDFSVGALFTQDYLDGGAEVLTLGPSATYKVHGLNFDLAVGFPVVQEDMPYGDSDFTVSAGLGFQF